MDFGRGVGEEDLVFETGEARERMNSIHAEVMR